MMVARAERIGVSMAAAAALASLRSHASPSVFRDASVATAPEARALAARLDRLNFRLLVVRRSADKVDRLHAVAAKLECEAWRLVPLLAELPELRAFVIYGEIARG